MDEESQQDRADRGDFILLRWIAMGGTRDAMLSRFQAVMYYLERRPQSELADQAGISQASISLMFDELKRQFGVDAPRVGRRKDRKPRKRRKIKINLVN